MDSVLSNAMRCCSCVFFAARRSVSACASDCFALAAKVGAVCTAEMGNGYLVVKGIIAFFSGLIAKLKLFASLGRLKYWLGPINLGLMECRLTGIFSQTLRMRLFDNKVQAKQINLSETLRY